MPYKRPSQAKPPKKPKPKAVMITELLGNRLAYRAALESAYHRRVVSQTEIVERALDKELSSSIARNPDDLEARRPCIPIAYTEGFIRCLTCQTSLPGPIATCPKDGQPVKVTIYEI
jgi:hypothetical protein